MNYEKYCHVCERVIKPEVIVNDDEDNLIYVHDDRPHTDEDIKAFDNGGMN